MSETEDFLFQINPEELYPEKSSPPESKRRKLDRKEKKKKKKKKMKISKKIPNHFIAFRIYNSVIRQRIAEVQKSIIERNPLLNSALIDPRTLHVTLAVTHLKNEEDEQELKKKLDDWGVNSMGKHFGEPLNLNFKGVGAFRKAVAFVKIEECENYKRLCNLSSAVRELLNSSGFYSENERDFTPHLTLLKLSKNYKLLKEKKDFSNDFELMTKCVDDFGTETVEDLQLLSMHAKKDEDGYYKCLWKMKTMQTSNEEAKT